MHYTAYVHKEGKHWLAEFPDAPGCQTFAGTLDALTELAQEAIEGWLETHLIDGEAPPRPKQRHRVPAGRRLVQIPVDPVLSAALGIRWARQDAGLSQGELAKRIGTTQQQIARLESPDASPTIRSLLQVVSGLGKHLDLTIYD